MLTVPEAARRISRNPETIRRWIRAGRLRSQKIGTQYLVDEADLDALADSDDEMLPLPAGWQRTIDGSPMPNIVRAVRESRRGR
ncbi:MAG: helix-turn-helix domain-containing protein [Euzebyales bacterium]|nr:helix-turn-helix domain-containing protein [Euzebyales bacterium]MDQ3342587.1 helix-turn-helix domain-containing protein [Actinomycetota bacterium]